MILLLVKLYWACAIVERILAYRREDMRADMCSDWKTHLKGGEAVSVLDGMHHYSII